MEQESTKTITCDACKQNECAFGYPKGMPSYCEGQRYLDVLNETKTEYFKPENADIHKAAAKILSLGHDQWTRLEESIEFAKELGVSRIGLAICVGLIREGREFARFFRRAGFEVMSVACMIGGVRDTETGIPEEYAYPTRTTCNPIAQAEILNREQTELNFMVGLCLGHDILFIKHSEALVAPLVVKDKVLVNNPSAVLYSMYHRQRLADKYGRD